MVISLYLAILILLIFFVFRKYKKKGLIIVGVLLALIVGGSQYIFYIQPLMEKKQEVKDYFLYFEEVFDFHDSLANYGWEKDYSNTPVLYFTFNEYGQEQRLNNYSVLRNTKKDKGVRILRNHILAHYLAYIDNKYVYETELNNDFSQVEDYLEELGYICYWDYGKYFETEEGFKLYSDRSVRPNLRVNRSHKTISLEEEMAFYKGKSMESFDYQEYMEYFDYGVVLTGTYAPKEGEEPEPINQRELDKVVEEAMQNGRITVLLTPNQEVK
ncbi:hypothetical protein [Enterococcus sp. LJL51]|uniref:hypothetical protein n=1 Tax=Enterococcus sp. LJL51 TaxID=3416656 RepID=UPI003CF77094